MGSALTLIGALLPFVIQELQQFKVVSPAIGGIITGVEGAVAAFIAQFQAGGTSTPTVTALSLLSAISAAVAVLKTQKDANGNPLPISVTTLAIITAIDTAVAAGIQASNQVTSVDPTKLQPITPLA